MSLIYETNLFDHAIKVLNDDITKCKILHNANLSNSSHECTVTGIKLIQRINSSKMAIELLESNNAKIDYK